MTTEKAIEIAKKIQLSGNPLWLEVKRLACDYENRIAGLEASLLDVTEKTMMRIVELEAQIEKK